MSKNGMVALIAIFFGEYTDAYLSSSHEPADLLGNSSAGMRPFIFVMPCLEFTWRIVATKGFYHSRCDCDPILVVKKLCEKGKRKTKNYKKG